MDLRIEDLTIAIGKTIVVRELSLKLEPGKIAGIIGPNGSGKSTVLRCVYRALKPTRGAVYIAGTELSTLSHRASARKVAALPQNSTGDLDFTVAEMVALGRAPHRDRGRPTTRNDRRICEDAMERMAVSHLADRGVLSLSGGERQRVLIARALAQTPRVLILDEPTNHLDLRHQIQLLRILREMKLSVLIVLHDLNLTAAVCDAVSVMDGGRLVAHGTPSHVLTRELLRDVFAIDATVTRHPVTRAPQVLYDLT